MTLSQTKIKQNDPVHKMKTSTATVMIVSTTRFFVHPSVVHEYSTTIAKEITKLSLYPLQLYESFKKKSQQYHACLHLQSSNSFHQAYNLENLFVPVDAKIKLINLEFKSYIEALN